MTVILLGRAGGDQVGDGVRGASALFVTFLFLHGGTYSLCQ